MFRLRRHGDFWGTTKCSRSCRLLCLVVCVTVRGHHETKIVKMVPMVPMVPMVTVWNVSCRACQYEDILWTVRD